MRYNKKYTLFPLNGKMQVIDMEGKEIFSSINTTEYYGVDKISELFTEHYLRDLNNWYVVAEPMGNSSILYLVEDYSEYDAIMQVVGDDIEGEYDAAPPMVLGTVSNVSPISLV